MAKKPYVIGNWKMYKTAREATDYIETLLPLIEGVSVNIFLAVPFTSIAPAVQFARETPVVIGAQNMNDAREGAFTGEIAGLMLKEAGADFVILGHSERRKLFGETNEIIHKKVMRALQDDLIVVLCVGETLEDHQSGKKEEVLREQIEKGLSSVPKEELKKIILAYEPVWAIGTGQSAEAGVAQEAHEFCRTVLADLFGKRAANSVPILYGGSVKPENTQELLAQKEIDGVLVGGASLDPERLASIIKNTVIKKGKKS